MNPDIPRPHLRPALAWLASLLSCLAAAAAPEQRVPEPLPGGPVPAWPSSTRESRPWTYWWWPGSAVDEANITRELERFAAAGFGGVHIIPIYGAKGAESRYIEYLSPTWLGMLRHTVGEGRRLGLGVDMTTGSGWCFGGPSVGPEDANASVQVRVLKTEAGKPLGERFEAKGLQALTAFGPNGERLSLFGRLSPAGAVDWVPAQPGWTVYAVSQKPSGQKVKRAGPGGQGHMLNLFHPPGVGRLLDTYTKAFAGYDGPWPRAMYHDSYEYKSDWSPSLFAAFADRRGYRLEDELQALFSKEPTGDREHTARVKCDYRETLADLLTEESLPRWVDWCRSRGIMTRNQAHGSPGNLLDLYGLVDVPETEMFHADRDILASKFASSAAHVLGRKLVASETGTWLREHFTETLGDLKRLQDDLFLAGVNHIVYHGSCYSPEDAAWPGWLFYASTEMNWRNPIWRDVPALNAYASRCMGWLQGGRPDSDVLVYWPIHDLWHQAEGMVMPLTIHGRKWLHGQPLGAAATLLWRRGYGFDYVSDRQLVRAAATDGRVALPGGTYQVMLIPRCHLIPHDTFNHLLELAAQGATVAFEGELPKDVPGLGSLDKRRVALASARAPIQAALEKAADAPVRVIVHGKGRIVVGPIDDMLKLAGVQRETLVDNDGLAFIRRAYDSGRVYFVANKGEQPYSGWLPLSWWGAAVAVQDPLSGRSGFGNVRRSANGGCEVRVDLPPGGSLILRTLVGAVPGPRSGRWEGNTPAGEGVEIKGKWTVDFGEGGPKAPVARKMDRPQLWSSCDDPEAQAFSGTARYSVSFAAPDGRLGPWLLDLGEVAQSARVVLNGAIVGTSVMQPHVLRLPTLRPEGNLLEIEVTSVAANRIRDLDRRRVAWRIFNDINFVNIDYKPFDASSWPITPGGLAGPVRLRPPAD